MPLIPENIPPECKALPQWCVYKLEEVNGERTKVPYNSTTGYRASTIDPTTWSSFNAALAAYEELEIYNGICFMLTEETGIVFIDLDHCIENNTVAPWALGIIELFDSYTERSQSGKGIHILVKGRKPGPRCRKAAYPHPIEIYDHARQCCLTGDVI